jgi:hypothetical protein
MLTVRQSFSANEIALFCLNLPKYLPYITVTQLYVLDLYVKDADLMDSAYLHVCVFAFIYTRHRLPIWASPPEEY